MFNISKQLHTLSDVKDFARCLYDTRKVVFHPDDDFGKYVNENGSALFGYVEAKLLNSRMSECFDICEAIGTDAHDYMYSFSPMAAFQNA